MNIIFAGSKGKTGSVIFSYLKNKGYEINQVNLNEKQLKDIIIPNSIVIDFTNKDVAYKHALLCLEYNCHFICGTTGIDEETITFLKQKAQVQNLHFVFNPNFSLGIPLILPFINSLKEDFPTTQISESHHISKLDMPSGTALLLKKNLYDSTSIESIRTSFPTLDHTITMSNEYETITITHHAHNKLAYAQGVEKTLKELIAKTTISNKLS